MTQACGHREGGRGGCHKTQGQLKTLADIVAGYISCNRKCLKDDLERYEKSGTWAKAVELAARAEGHDGKMYSHQRRVGRENMALTAKPLLALGRRKFGDFDALHEAVREAIQGITRVDVLAVYDTALRLGAFRGVLPECVYLHAGTKTGAKNLGFDNPPDKLAMSDLPSEFRKLKAYEVENCLCIYKEHFKAVSALQKV